ncbi:MAG: hypothetical protein WDA14_09145 [Sphaerochaetaceae bacterium]
MSLSDTGVIEGRFLGLEEIIVCGQLQCVVIVVAKGNSFDLINRYKCKPIDFVVDVQVVGGVIDVDT